ncbi:serine phosphatase RsbU (regulator of sigma subunit)/tetratricopeptide (TPR) repeat protein [Thermonema lapsum]|uniref:Serine phosphatase RsbU (Regulator of sigma subunit)/tetratricopeptide (TPR) repeat protein n=1 Tax=Thermonema lapsum TaxID=28195 RepID=A0A846MPL7_9BACT|nr:tetratricopeptide repeat protein [Thermonema lapsum]NIK73503.1 serine phosphatase RsbU (regulator of sigma subunit)/tetratricopeptide (TPR) repeat protein [Thermonema lapsum]
MLKHLSLACLLLLLFFHLPLPLCAQEEVENKIAKLEQELARARDTRAIDICVNLTNEYLFYDLDRAFKYAHLALQKAETKNYLYGIMAARVALGNCYLYRSEQNDLLSAFEQYMQVIETPLTPKQEKNCRLLLEKAKALNGLGSLYQIWGDFKKAIELHTNSLKIREDCGDPIGIARCYNSIGLVYDNMGNYDEAIRYYSRALNLYEKHRRMRDVAGVLNNLAAATHLKLLQSQSAESYEQVFDYYHRSLKISEELKDRRGMARIYNNMGILYAEKGNFDEALDLYFRAAMIDEEENDPAEAAATFNNIARLFEQKEEWLVALDYYRKALESAAAVESKSALLNATQGLSRVYAQMGDYYQAFQYAQMSNRLQKELYDVETSRRIALISSQYEIEKKQKQIELLEREKELQKLKEEQLQQYIILGTLLLAMLSILVLLLFNRYRFKSKLNKQLQALYRELEIQYKRTEDSIQYASRIQQAMIPKPEALLTPFREIGIFYRPKSIVSGDFYWCKEVGNKKVIFVADCTGHGVPGALMTVLSMNLIDKLVNEMKDNLHPDELLRQLDQHIQQALSDEKVQDGLDGAILIVEGNRLEYAGAKFPLYLFHDNDFFVFNAARISLGNKSYIYNKEKVFTLHKLELKPGDKIYLHSDGFPDQFGGEKERKYMSKRFRELLQRHAALPLQEQARAWEKEFEHWKGNKDQTDDVLVIGFMY